MKTLIALLLVAFAPIVVAQDAPKPLGYVKEGVYFFRNTHQTNILELKDGRFRIWLDYTVSVGARPNNPGEPRFDSSLHSGNYRTNGGVVTFVLPNRRRHHFTSMEYKGDVTLWDLSGVMGWEERKAINPYSILTRTDSKPEDILAGK